VARLAGFRYREIVKRLKQLGFPFDRQARGSHKANSRKAKLHFGLHRSGREQVRVRLPPT
jgi:hypothetical protein